MPWGLGFRGFRAEVSGRSDGPCLKRGGGDPEKLPVTFPGLSPGIWEKHANPPNNPCNIQKHEGDRELKDVCVGLCVDKTHKLKCYKAWGGRFSW